MSRASEQRLVRIKAAFVVVQSHFLNSCWQLTASTDRAMATQQSDIIERAVKAALADIEKYAPQEFQQLQADPARKEDLIQAAKVAAEEEVKLAEEFRTRPSENIAERLSKHLPTRRVQLIQTGLQVPTYRLDICKKDDGHHWADVTRDGEPFMESKKLNALAAIDETTWIQVGSVIIEAVIFALRAVGIDVPAFGKKVMNDLLEKLKPIIDKLSPVIKALQTAAEDGSKPGMAKAIFDLLKQLHSYGVLWTIIKGICTNMSTWDWIKTAAIVTAQLIAALGTDGAALIAEIVLALYNATSFIQKLLNLQQLDALRKEVKV